MSLKSILLGHKLFIAVMVAFTALVVGLLLYFQFSGPQRVSRDELLEVPTYRPRPAMPMTVYCNGFDVDDTRLLVLAAERWRQATSGTIDISPVAWEPPQPFSASHYETYVDRTLWQIDAGTDEAALLFAKYRISTDGFAVGNFIAIIRDPELDKQQRLRMFAHELGHLAGLEHIREAYPALMNLRAKDAITTWDKMQVEYAYDVLLL